MAKLKKLLKKLKTKTDAEVYICPVCKSKSFDGSSCFDCYFDAFCMF